MTTTPDGEPPASVEDFNAKLAERPSFTGVPSD